MRTHEVLSQIDNIKEMVNSKAMKYDDVIASFNALDNIVRGQYQILDEYNEKLNETREGISKCYRVIECLNEDALESHNAIVKLKKERNLAIFCCFAVSSLTIFLILNILSVINF